MPGLGDEAYARGNEIFALSGNAEIIVATTGGPTTGMTDNATMAMVQAIIDALPGQ